MRNSNVIWCSNKDKSSNSLFEISIFPNSSFFPIVTLTLLLQPLTYLHFHFPICLALLLFYLYTSFSFLWCTFFSLVNKHIHLKKLKNYFLTTAAAQSTFLWAFCTFRCLFHFYAFIFKLHSKDWLWPSPPPLPPITFVMWSVITLLRVVWFWSQALVTNIFVADQGLHWRRSMSASNCELQ